VRRTEFSPPAITTTSGFQIIMKSRVFEEGNRSSLELSVQKSHRMGSQSEVVARGRKGSAMSAVLAAG